MQSQQQHTPPHTRVIQFLKTSGHTTSREEKDTLVSQLTIKETETALLTFMTGHRHLTLISTLRKIYEYCTENEAPYDVNIIVSDATLYNIFRKAIFHTNDIKDMLLLKVTITMSNAPEYLLDLKLYKLTGLPILTTMLPNPIHTRQPARQDLGPANRLQAFYTDDTDSSTTTGPPPLETPPELWVENSSDSTTSEASETYSTSQSPSSSSNPDQPKPITCINPTYSSGADDEHTNTQNNKSITRPGPTKCIICSQPNLEHLQYCQICWRITKSMRPPHKRKHTIPSFEIAPPQSTLPTCITCNINPSNSAFVHGNTGHVTTCYPCSRRIVKQCHNRCPICNHTTSSIIKLFT